MPVCAGIVDGVRYAIGREQYITELFGRSDELPQAPKGGELWLLLASEARVLGWLLLQDSLRPDAADAVASLQSAGLQVEILSGDRPAAVAALASQTGDFPLAGRYLTRG